jgi:hypothetical protein
MNRCEYDPGGHKTSYSHSLQIFVMSYNVGLWQAFPAYSNVCEAKSLY